MLRQALAVDGPALVEAEVDPHVPPLPPMTTRKQAMHFLEAMLEGQPDRVDIAKVVGEEMLREVV